MNQSHDASFLISQIKERLQAQKNKGKKGQSILSGPLRQWLLTPLRGQKTLEEIEREAQECTRCSLYRERKRLVFGKGNPKATLLLVGEAPGREEDLRGEPFVGEAGALLTRMLKAIGLTREEVYIANVLKCRPPHNRDPLPEEVEACKPFLLSQIKAIGPKLIICLGAHSAHALLNTTEPIGRLRGTFYPFGEEGIKVMPTYHPAALLRNPELKKKVWEDLQKVKEEYERLNL